MSLLEKFYDTLPTIGFFIEQLDLDDTVIKDYSEYHVVDGEEGDYGIIRVYVSQGESSRVLVCTYINHGGDIEEYVFSNYGKELYAAKLMKVLELWVKS